MRALGVLASGLALWVGCDAPQPCDEYVDYMCDCHAEEVDCETLRQTYADAAPAVQDQCAIDLSDQEQADVASGTCDPDAPSDTDSQTTDTDGEAAGA